MTTRRFDVVLHCRDETGRFRMVAHVLASEAAEAAVLARASLALQDVECLDDDSVTDLGESRFEGPDVRRVTGLGARIYLDG